MTELVPDVSTPNDAELISRVRGGDTAAYGELFDRHRAAADRLARQLQRGPDSDDLVSEAFIKVLQVLQGGGGPDVAFRAYLLTAVRRLHVDRVRSARRTQPTDEVEQLDAGIPFQDTAVDGFERSVTARAFASLPERWQLVLWHLEVEGNKPADVAPMLGMSPNSVSALAYRAREGLRQAYLQMHLADTAGEHCRWTTEHLGAYVRGGLARRDATKVDHHLQGCRRCTGIYLELTEVNSDLRGLLAPLLLGTLAPGYLAATSAATGAGTTFGFAALLDRLSDGIKAMSTNASVGGAMAGAVVVAGVTTLVIVGTNGPDDVQAKPRIVTPTDIAALPPTSPAPGTSPSGQPTPPSERLPQPRASAPPTSGPTSDQSVAVATGESPGQPDAVPTTDIASAADSEPVTDDVDGASAGRPGTGTHPGTAPVPSPGSPPGNDPGTGPTTEPAPGPGPSTDPEPQPKPQPVQLSVGVSAQRTGANIEGSISVGNHGDVDGVRLIVTFSGSTFHDTAVTGNGWTCNGAGDRATCSASGGAAGTLSLHTKSRPRDAVRLSVEVRGDSAKPATSDTSVEGVEGAKKAKDGKEGKGEEGRAKRPTGAEGKSRKTAGGR